MRLVRVSMASIALAFVGILLWRLTLAPDSAGPLIDIGVVVGSAGLVVTGSGLAVWQHRPHSSIGPLLSCTGLATLLSAFAGVQPVELDIAGSLAWAATPLAIGQVLLGYPDGLRRRPRIVALIVLWVIPAALGVALLLVADSWDPARLMPYTDYSYRHTALPLSDRPRAAEALAQLWSAWVGVSAVAIVVAAHVRLRRYPEQLRTGLRSVRWAGVAWAVTMLGSIPFTVQTIDSLSRDRGQELLVVAGVILPAVAAATIAGAIAWADVVRPRLDPTRTGRITLTGEPYPVADLLRRQLATAVGDPSLRLAIMGQDGRWLAPDGTPVAIRDDGERAAATLTRNGEVIAALEVDQSLRASPDRVVVAATMAGLAVDNVRLAALDAAQLAELRNSGAALLDASDRARTRLTKDITAGPAAALQELASRAASGADRIEIGRGLTAVAADVRTISHGLFPPELERGGLAAALDDTVDVPTRRFPSAVELTAYLAAVGHAGARIADEVGQLVIEFAGSVSEHAAIRIAALDGTVTARDRTTTIRIPVPE